MMAKSRDSDANPQIIKLLKKAAQTQVSSHLNSAHSSICPPVLRSYQLNVNIGFCIIGLCCCVVAHSLSFSYKWLGMAKS